MVLFSPNALLTGEPKRWLLPVGVACLLLHGACTRDQTSRTASLAELQPLVLLQLPASAFKVDVASFSGSEWALWRTAALAESVVVPHGVQGVALEARGTSCSGKWPIADLFVHGAKVGSITVSASQWSWYMLPVTLAPGLAELKIAFVNDRFSKSEDMNLFIRNVMLVGDASEE